MKRLCVILGDQLSLTLSSLKQCDKERDIILMCEVWEEATYVKHHKKKIAFLFSAMRHFAKALREQGYRVDYRMLDDLGEEGSFTLAVEQAVRRHHPDTIIVTHPGEYRVLHMIQQWQERFSVPVEIVEDDRFLSSLDDFARWTVGRKSLRMEYFYREMRVKYDLLMTDGREPEGGQWNYDAENRKPPARNDDIPKPYSAEKDEITQEVLDLVARRFPDHFGALEPFEFAVTREQALAALQFFISQRLPSFGDYQDAMLQGQPWMYHSHLAFYLNCGLLLPLECVTAAQAAYHAGAAPLNAVEGFIRQIIGWREYVRGIYWLRMPEYREVNYFDAQRSLPDFFWTAETDLNCLHQVISETKYHAYAHHIQRLMVVGNFALLAGLDPKLVNEWYLLVYADAYEWVELPNVSGMALFADGGYLASKPYAAGGGYIHKMSDYCQRCHYDVTEKIGLKACPFNYLYWDFLIRNRPKLAGNPRIAVMYKTLDRMSPEKIEAIQADSRSFLDGLS